MSPKTDRLYANKRQKILRLSSGASAAIQDSAVPPSVRSLCCSAARSYLCRLASGSPVAWNTAGPSFINCPYHAHNEFLRGGRYGHREGCYSGFIGPFEDARHPYSRRNLYLLPPWRRALLPRVKPCLYEASRSWLADLNFRATMTSQH